MKEGFATCNCIDHTQATYGLSIADAVLGGIVLILQLINGIACKKGKKSASLALAGVAAGLAGPAFIFNIPILAFRNDIFTHGNCAGFPPVEWPALALVCGILGFGVSVACAILCSIRAGPKTQSGAAVTGKVAQGTPAAVVATPDPTAAPPPTPGQVPYPGAPAQGAYAVGAQTDPYSVYPGTEMTNYSGVPYLPFQDRN